MRILLGLVFIVFSVAAGAQADSYFCVADMATGFSFDKTTKTWKQANFDVSDNKYLFARSKDENYKWDVTKIGDKVPTSFCKNDLGGTELLLRCLGIMDFYFSAKRLRFQVVYTYGYVIPDLLGSKEGDNAPFITIGKCSPL